MIDLINEYKRLKEKNYKSRFGDISVFVSFFSIVMLVTIFGYFCNIFKPNFFIFILGMFSILFMAAGIGFFSFLLSNRLEFIKFKLSEKVYKGELSDIFNLNDKETKIILSRDNKTLEDDLFLNKGIKAELIFALLNEIYSLKKLEKDQIDVEISEKNNTEEKEALISAGTKIGRMIEELRSMKN